LLDTLPTLLDDQPSCSAKIAMCLNQAALVEAARGDAARANAICDVHLHWVNRLASQHDYGYYELAIQPWINKGRLRRREKLGRSALEHFSLIQRYLAREPLVLGPCLVSYDTCAQIMEHNPSILSTLRNTYVVDSLKTFFGALEFDDALIFVRRERDKDLCRDTELLVEGELIGLLGARRFAQACKLSATSRGDHVSCSVVYLLYQGLSLSGLREVAKARVLARELAAFVEATELDFFSQSTALRYLYSLASLLEQLREEHDAFSMFEKGYQLALAVDDQLFSIKFMTALARLSGRVEAADWRSRRAGVLQECHYAEILRAEGVTGPAGGTQIFDDLSTYIFRNLAPP